MRAIERANAKFAQKVTCTLVHRHLSTHKVVWKSTAMYTVSHTHEQACVNGLYMCVCVFDVKTDRNAHIMYVKARLAQLSFYKRGSSTVFVWLSSAAKPFDFIVSNNKTFQSLAASVAYSNGSIVG